MADDVASLLDYTLAKHVKVHMIGHSLGARVATLFASKYRGRIASLVLEDMHFKGVGNASSLVQIMADIQVMKVCLIPLIILTNAAHVIYESKLSDERKWKMLNQRHDYLVMCADSKVRLRGFNLMEEAIALELGQTVAGITVPVLFMAADPATGTAYLRDKGIEHLQLHMPRLGKLLHFPALHMAFITISRKSI